MGSRPSSETVPEPPSLLRMQNGDPGAQLSRSFSAKVVQLNCCTQPGTSSVVRCVWASEAS